MSNPITSQLIYEVTNVSSPSFAPNSSHAVYVESKINRKTMQSESNVMLLDIRAGTSETYTSGNKDNSPHFSPNGKILAFCRPDSDARNQIWTMATSGGEAKQLTCVPDGVTEFSWSPDSTKLAFISDVDPDRLPSTHDHQNQPQVRIARRITYRADGLGWRGSSRRHLFAVEIINHSMIQLTSGDWDDASPRWSPDGGRIAFISARKLENDISRQTEAYVIASSGGSAMEWSAGLHTVGSITWSPDGNQLAVIGTEDPEIQAYSQGYFYILSPKTVPVKLTNDNIKPAVGLPPLSPSPDIKWNDQDELLFIADNKGESFVCKTSINTKETQILVGGESQLTDISIDPTGNTAVVVRTSPHTMGELYLVGIKDKSLIPLTNLNEAYFGNHPPAQMVKKTLSREGMQIESRLLFPPDFNKTKEYPLIVDIHGGPNAAFFDNFNPLQQILATAGYLVLCVNPRGSATYGLEFVRAVLRDWGGEDFKDIMASLDMVCKLPYVDSSRLGVTGYSYGGFMTSWVIGHDNRFKAAVVGAPCIDLASMYGTSDIGVPFGELQWGGTRQDKLQTFIEHSPITYVDQIDTPVLLLHGESDHRCPIEQSEQFFVSLKRMGKEVEFVRFPGSSHGFLRGGHPILREEYLNRILNWFNKLL